MRPAHPEKMPGKDISSWMEKGDLQFDILALKDFSVTLDPLNAANQTQSGSNSRKSSGSATSTTNAASLKKAKWHLGIRSQSKPQDIMNEVFKAMKELGLVSVEFLQLSFLLKQNSVLGMEIL